MYYLTEIDPRGAMGLGGKEEVNVVSLGSHLDAIDYKTGKTIWSHNYPSDAGPPLSGILTTAGRLLFAGDNAGNFIAFDPGDGNILWHSRIGQVTNAPETYMVDGRRIHSRRCRRHVVRVYALLISLCLCEAKPTVAGRPAPPAGPE